MVGACIVYLLPFLYFQPTYIFKSEVPSHKVDNKWKGGNEMGFGVRTQS